MELKDIFQKLNSGEVKMHSELGTRDESKQTKNFGSRLQKMKTVTGINARALVMKDLVIPFNPMTGVADDNYNDKSAFRPILLVSQAIELINQACANNAETKEFWKKELNLSDIPSGAATMEEYNAFKSKGYIKPRVMSYYTVAINLNGSHGFPEFKVKYTVDPTELVDGSYDYNNSPVWHKEAILFNSIAKQEADDLKRRLEAEGANKDTIQTQRRAVFQKSPIGFVSPTNLIPFLYIPHTEAPKDISLDNPKEFEQYIRFYSYTDKFTTPINEAFENPIYDSDMDFFDLTIKTPSSKDTSPSGKVYTDEDANALYQAMSISNTDGRLALHGGSSVVNGVATPNERVFDNLLKASKAYFLYSQDQSSTEGGETFEKIMAASNRMRPITSVVDNLLPACNEVFTKSFANSKWFTEQIRNANSEILIAMNPDNAIALAEADEEDLEQAKEQAKASVAEIIAENTVQPGNTINTETSDDSGVGSLELDLE